MLTVKKSKVRPFRLTDIRRDEVELLPDEHFVRWIEENTSWGLDLDPGSGLELMRRIWKAERVDGQLWKVTCRRRRGMSNGIQKRETVVVTDLSDFPSGAMLEELVALEGFGGGEFTVSSTRRLKVSYRFRFHGEPEDPVSLGIPIGPAPAGAGDRTEEIKGRLIEIGMRYLEQNPEVGRVVALKYLGKVLGIAIPLPDPSAPVPYADLSPDDQDWLDEHPEAKGFCQNSGHGQNNIL